MLWGGKHLSRRTILIDQPKMDRAYFIPFVSDWKCLPSYLSLIILLMSCTYAEDQFEEPEEANARVLAAYAYKDNACGTSHQLTIPILSNARSEDVDLCITEIMASDCAAWGSENNLPLACLAISIEI